MALKVTKASIIKELYEPRNQELMLRQTLRHLRQKDTFAVYLDEFQKIINGMVHITETEKFSAFLDGLSDVFKHEILKESSCQTVTQAIPICSNYEFCMKSGNKQRENVFVLSKTFGGQNKNFIRPPFRKNFSSGPGFHQKFPKSNNKG